MAKIFRPNGPTQRAFLFDTTRYLLLMGGIGSGKTAAGAVKAVKKLEQGDGIIVSPDFPHFTKSTWPEFKKWLPWSMVENGHLNHPYTQSKELKVRVGDQIRTIYYGGIDRPEAWAGPSVNWAWFDEARRKKTRQAFDILAGRIRVGTKPQLFITTTPRGSVSGKMHWLRSVFEREEFPQEVLEAFEGASQDLVKYYSMSTDENKVNLDPMYYASLMGLYSGQYATQELGGKFVNFEGLVYDNWSTENVTEDAEYRAGVPVIWAVDDGFTEGHPRVILMAQIVPPYINVFNEYVAIREHAETTIDNALELCPAKPAVARVDSSAAEFISRLWERGIETYRGSHDVGEGIKHMYAMIRDGEGQVHLRFHERCEFSTGEILGYVYPDTVEGGISPASDRAARPLKESDNAADAARYLVWPVQLEDLRAGRPFSTEMIRIPEQLTTTPTEQPAGVPNDSPPTPQAVNTPLRLPRRQGTHPLAALAALGVVKRPGRKPRLRSKPPGW